MVAPDIETSTREERLEFIREEFKCLGNCPICEKCSFLGDARLKTSMPTTSKGTVLSGTSRQSTGIVATLSGLDRKEVDKAFAQLKSDLQMNCSLNLNFS